MNIILCEHCEKEFKPKVKFCSNRCRYAHRIKHDVVQDNKKHDVVLENENSIKIAESLQEKSMCNC